MLTPEACTPPETTHRLYEVQEIKKTKNIHIFTNKKTLTVSMFRFVLHVLYAYCNYWVFNAYCRALEKNQVLTKKNIFTWFYVKNYFNV